MKVGNKQPNKNINFYGCQWDQERKCVSSSSFSKNLLTFMPYKFIHDLAHRMQMYRMMDIFLQVTISSLPGWEELVFL